MKDGTHVDADFIISATGLTLGQNLPFSTIKVTVDEKPFIGANHVMYNSVMINDVPNFGFIMGYTNASWTLKADIASIYFTKLLNHMKDNNFIKVEPKVDPNTEMDRYAFSGGLTSGYFARAADVLPKQGTKDPWQGGVNYLMDLFSLYFKKFSTDSLEFTIVSDALHDKKNL